MLPPFWAPIFRHLLPRLVFHISHCTFRTLSWSSPHHSLTRCCSSIPSSYVPWLQQSLERIQFQFLLPFPLSDRWLAPLCFSRVSSASRPWSHPSHVYSTRSLSLGVGFQALLSLCPSGGSKLDMIVRSSKWMIPAIYSPPDRHQSNPCFIIKIEI